MSNDILPIIAICFVFLVPTISRRLFPEAWPIVLVAILCVEMVLVTAVNIYLTAKKKEKEKKI